MPGGVKAEDPKSCVGATEIRKKSVPNSNGPVEIVLSIGIQRAITGPEILQTGSWAAGTGDVAGDFRAVSATPAVFHPIPPMKYWLIQRYS